MSRHQIRTSCTGNKVQEPDFKLSSLPRRVPGERLGYGTIVRKRLWCFILKILDTRVPVLARSSLSPEARQEIKAFLEPGDVLLESNKAYPGWQLVSRVMAGSRWMHAAIYIGDGVVIDAGTEPCVARVSLDDFLSTTDIVVYRPKFATPEDTQAAVSYVVNQIGTPFNVSFDHSDNKSFYCSQLVSQALLSMPHPITLSMERVLWKKLVPLTAIEKSSDMDCVWSTDGPTNDFAWSKNGSTNDIAEERLTVSVSAGAKCSYTRLKRSCAEAGRSYAEPLRWSVAFGAVAGGLYAHLHQPTQALMFCAAVAVLATGKLSFR